MSRLRYLLLLICILITLNVQAETLQCVGMIKNGDTIHVIFDPSSWTLNIDGDLHKIVAPTVGNNGLATENFYDIKGLLVYVSITVTTKKNITLNLYNAKTNQVLDTIFLACHK